MDQYPVRFVESRKGNISPTVWGRLCNTHSMMKQENSIEIHSARCQCCSRKHEHGVGFILFPEPIEGVK